MKLGYRDIDPFLKKPDARALAVLIYGPDEGLVRERMTLLTKTVVADTNDPFNVTDITGTALDADPAKLLDEAQSISMLGGRRVVRVRGADDGQKTAIESALKALRAGDNLVLIEAGDLNKNSKLRTLFENADNAAALPCYADDARNIGQVIATQLRENGYGIAPEAVQIMAANVQGDRAVARSEVEKLITYLGMENPQGYRVTMEDALACSGDGGQMSFDDLNRATASGLFAEADRTLATLLSEGVFPVSILRAQQNYFTRLHLTRSRIDAGEGFERALGMLRPPLFFKMKDAFVHQLRLWDLPNLDRALEILREAELHCKQSALPAETICGRAIFSLAMNAQRLARTGNRRTG